MGTSLRIAYAIRSMYTCQTCSTYSSLLLPRAPRQTNRNGLDASDIHPAHRKIGAVGTSVIYLAFGNLQLYTQLSAAGVAHSRDAIRRSFPGTRKSHPVRR